jgi:hypothetical protein
MKKIIIAVVIIICANVSGFSQSITYDRSSLYIAGSGTLENGQYVIKYTHDPSFLEIYVSLTPAGSYLQLFVEKKEAGVITVKSANAKQGCFDYLIVVKRKVSMVGNTKQ